MRAGLRFRMSLLAGGLLFAPLPAFAQDTTPPATTNTPATDAIGPRELQNFSLPGTTTKASDQPAPAATAPANPPAGTTPVPERTGPAPLKRAPAPAQQSPAARVKSEAAGAATGTQVPTPQPVATSTVPSAVAPNVSTMPASPSAQPPAPLARERKIPFLPWLIAALALAGGTAFLLWLRRPREALAGGAGYDMFVPPEPAPVPPARPVPRAAPTPQPAPAPQPAPLPAPKPATPVSSGIVASRLRPSLEIDVHPVRCVVQDDQVAIEFEVDLFNAGTAPARAVHAEASLFNAGANQDQELSVFFANPAGSANRIDAIPPMKRLTLTSQVVAPRDAIQEYELGGRKSFVPLIAFNALYEWSGGQGQTSAAFLVGRDTGGEKLGPFHLDNGVREVRGLGARSLPSAIRS